MDLDKMVADAIKRLQLYINRSAAQHLRQLRAQWRKK